MKGVLEAERSRRAALLPPDASCEACGEPDPLKLDADAATVLCADDAAIACGRELVERHHLAGRSWPIVLDLTPNWHRIVSTLQRARRTDHKFVVALLCGIADLIYAIADFLRGDQSRG